MKRGVKLLVSLSAVLLIQPAIVPTASGGDCYSDCVIRNGCFNSHPFADSDCYSLCRDTCRPDGWGAIAYSTRDMGAGWAHGKPDRASAEKEAMNVCSQRGKACVLRTAFNKQCGALAADRDFTSSGTSTDQREAMQKAIAACKQAGGTNCALHVMFCSF
jgi:hypothetical protein